VYIHTGRGVHRILVWESFEKWPFGKSVRWEDNIEKDLKKV
jgi:hypothetical protein